MGARVVVAGAGALLLTALVAGGVRAPGAPVPSGVGSHALGPVPTGLGSSVLPPTAVTPTAPWPDVRYRAPVPGAPRVVRAFDRPVADWAAGHRGVDLALAPGGEVLAAGPGTVVFAGPVVDRPVVSVQHADGIRTTYEPVTAVVTPGQHVTAGQVLGHLSGPGHCDGCLHWGARREGYLDPMSLLAGPVVRLLPG